MLEYGSSAMEGVHTGLLNSIGDSISWLPDNDKVSHLRCYRPLVASGVALVTTYE